MVREVEISKIEQLIKFWQRQNIKIICKSNKEINILEQKFDFSLPDDFKELYSRVNGMQNYYPNEFDDEGFLFYPIEGIIPLDMMFENEQTLKKERILIFADYMHKSWYYGFKLTKLGHYEIGIIANEETFKIITCSLFDFIQLYFENSSKLYDYS